MKNIIITIIAASFVINCASTSPHYEAMAAQEKRGLAAYSAYQRGEMSHQEALEIMQDALVQYNFHANKVNQINNDNRMWNDLLEARMSQPSSNSNSWQQYAQPAPTYNMSDPNPSGGFKRYHTPSGTYNTYETMSGRDVYVTPPPN